MQVLDACCGRTRTSLSSNWKLSMYSIKSVNNVSRVRYDIRASFMLIGTFGSLVAKTPREPLEYVSVPVRLS